MTPIRMASKQPVIHGGVVLPEEVLGIVRIGPRRACEDHFGAAAGEGLKNLETKFGKG